MHVRARVVVGGEHPAVPVDRAGHPELGLADQRVPVLDRPQGRLPAVHRADLGPVPRGHEQDVGVHAGQRREVGVEARHRGQPPVRGVDHRHHPRTLRVALQTEDRVRLVVGPQPGPGRVEQVRAVRRVGGVRQVQVHGDLEVDPLLPRRGRRLGEERRFVGRQDVRRLLGPHHDPRARPRRLPRPGEQVRVDLGELGPHERGILVQHAARGEVVADQPAQLVGHPRVRTDARDPHARAGRRGEREHGTAADQHQDEHQAEAAARPPPPGRISPHRVGRGREPPDQERDAVRAGHPDDLEQGGGVVLRRGQHAERRAERADHRHQELARDEGGGEQQHAGPRRDEPVQRERQGCHRGQRDDAHHGDHRHRHGRLDHPEQPADRRRQPHQQQAGGRGSGAGEAQQEHGEEPRRHRDVEPAVHRQQPQHRPDTPPEPAPPVDRGRSRR